MPPGRAPTRSQVTPEGRDLQPCIRLVVEIVGLGVSAGRVTAVEIFDPSLGVFFSVTRRHGLRFCTRIAANPPRAALPGTWAPDGVSICRGLAIDRWHHRGILTRSKPGPIGRRQAMLSRQSAVP
jgi:hypothetical protein